MPDHSIDITKRNKYKTEKSVLYLKLQLVKTKYLVMYTFPFTVEAIVIKEVPTDYRAVISR